MPSPRHHALPGRLLTRALPVLVMMLLASVMILSFAAPQGSYSLGGGRGWSSVLQHTVLVLLAATAALIIAAMPRIVRSAAARYRHHAPPKVAADDAIASDGATNGLRRAGWRVVLSTSGATRFSHHRWSYWSAVALHIGLVLVLVAAFAVFATESAGTLIVHQGERIDEGTMLGAPVNGILAEEPTMPGTLIGGPVTVEYWPQGGTRQLTAEHFDAVSGESVVVAVNSVTRWRGARLFPSQTWGRTFAIRVSSPGGSEDTYGIDVPAGVGVGEAGYRDLELPGMPYLVRLKSVEAWSGEGATPVLRLRLEAGGTVVAEEALSVATTRTVGPFEMQLLDAASTWQEVVVVRQSGVMPLMLGIALVALGSIALYLFPAADVWIVEDGDVSRIVVRAGGLARQRVQDEVTRILEVGP